MDSDRLRQIEDLYHAVSDRPDRREELLNRADPDLRREVESLLRSVTGENPIDQLAAKLAGDATATTDFVGTHFGPYQIDAPIGAGGMGQVFRATDTRLGRAVALKVVPQQFTTRFGREARAISALNHPNICTLYDVGSNYLVMELLDGETLAQRLKKGALPIQQAISYGAQIAGALAAAHARGIIHRDLKPGNIMITARGIKVLDFGLAKSPQDETITAVEAVMGTPAYMAPEQREGANTGSFTDIYALGLVLYEMAMGKRAPSEQLPTFDGLPVEFAHVVERCLAKDPADRWHAAADVQAELLWADRRIGAQAAAPPNNATPWKLAAAAATLCLIALAAIWMLRPGVVRTPPQQVRFDLTLGQGSAGEGPDPVPVPSPDGSSMCFAASNSLGVSSLWIRPLASSDAFPIAGTEGAVVPFWSPDGQWVGFFAGGKIKKIKISGGPAETIGDASGIQEASWGADGVILFRPTNRSALFAIPVAGGAAHQQTKLDDSRGENSHRWVCFLPDGKRFLFYARSGQREKNGLYLGRIHSPKVTRLMAVDSNVSYIQRPQESKVELIYYREGGLVEQEFDADAEKLVGESKPLAEHVAYAPPSFWAHFAISDNGRTLLLRNAVGSTRFTWFTRDGSEIGSLKTDGPIMQPRIAPSGDRVAFSRPDDRTGNRDVWYIEVDRGIVHRLTTDGANDWHPVWSGNGKQLVFGSDRGGGTKNKTFLKNSLDPGSEESLTSLSDEPFDWSRDGQWITAGSADIVVTHMPDGKPFAFLATPAREGGARFSPDAKWIAYSSNESGRSEIYVRPFDGKPASAEGKVQISNAGGGFPVWRQDGKELYYMGGDLAIYAVDVKDLGRDKPTPLPIKLFRACPATKPEGGPLLTEAFQYNFDTMDGQKFLVNCRMDQPGRYQVILNP